MAGVLSGRLLGRFGAALAVSGGQIVPAPDGILGAVHGLDKAQAAVALDVGIAVAHGVIAVDGQVIAAAVWAGDRGQRKFRADCTKKTEKMGRMGGREREERNDTIGSSAAAWLRPVDAGKTVMAGRPEDNGEPPAGGGGTCTGKSAAAGAWCKKTGQAGIRCTL